MNPLSTRCAKWARRHDSPRVFHDSGDKFVQDIADLVVVPRPVEQHHHNPLLGRVPRPPEPVGHGLIEGPALAKFQEVPEVTRQLFAVESAH
jgi:hypothetical protein